MTQLICNGVLLDLYDDTSVQFVKVNPLFAFDKLTCERTTQFKLPCTRTNDAVLQLSRIPAYAGEGMRRRFAAKMYIGTVVKDGYLYVSEYDGENYAAIFVAGELLGLQAIKNAGKIADFMTFTNWETISTWGSSPSQAASSIWASVEYKKPAGDLLRPSIHLGLLYDAIMTQLGVRAAAIPITAAGVRIIAAEIKGVQKTELALTETAGNMATDGTYPVCLTADNDLAGNIIEYSTARVARRTNNGATIYTGTVRQYIAHQPLKLTFPDDWDDDLFVGYFISGYTQSEEYLLEIFSFLGDRSFDRSGNVTGESLRGRTIDIDRDGCFLIISKTDYVYIQESGGLSEGWGIVSHEVALTVEGREMTDGSRVRLQDNLPDMTAVELLKCIAAISGTALNYSDAQGVTFDAVEVENWANTDVRELLKRGQVTRTFSDYAQRNTVQFENGVGIEYTVDNDNIEKEKELQVLPFVQGGGSPDAIYIDDKIEGSVLGTNGGGQYLARVELIKNAGVQSLCDASTSTQVQARMRMPEFERLAAKSALLVDNLRYVWTEANWSKNAATLKLAKISGGTGHVSINSIRTNSSSYSLLNKAINITPSSMVTANIDLIVHNIETAWQIFGLSLRANTNAEQVNFLQRAYDAGLVRNAYQNNDLSLDLENLFVINTGILLNCSFSWNQQGITSVINGEVRSIANTPFFQLFNIRAFGGDITTRGVEVIVDNVIIANYRPVVKNGELGFLDSVSGDFITEESFTIGTI